MNANARFLEEAKVLEKRWSRLGDDFSRHVTAVMLESQRLMNEIDLAPANYWLNRYEFTHKESQ